jgi:hypothetical protein
MTVMPPMTPSAGVAWRLTLFLHASIITRNP